MAGDEKLTPEELRRRAEALLTARPAAPTDLNSEDLVELLHELQVHQFELELQNEELIRARQDAEAHHQRYFELFEQAPPGHLIVDGQGLIVQANAAAAALLGTPQDRLRGRACTRLVHPDDQDRHARHLRRTLERGERQSCELRVAGADGAVRHLCSESVRIRAPGDEGAAPRCLTTLTDITERKQAENALRAERDHIRALLDASPYPIIMTDITGVVTECNQATLDIVGVQARDAFVGRPSMDFLIPDDRMRAEDYRNQLLETGVMRDMEYRLVRPDGRERLVEASSAMLRDAAGEPQGFVAVIADITTRRAAEIQVLKSREELRRLSIGLQREIEKVRADIAREIHDELGGLLTAIKMDLSWIGKHLDGDEALLRERIDAATVLTDDATLTVRRIATELRPGMLDHLGLWAAIEWLAEDFQQRSGVECAVAFAAEETGLDPDQTIALFRTVQEALTNVARHANASQVRIGSRLKKDVLVIEVRDDGQGFEPDDLSSPGSTLGLVGMRERLQHLGGQVDIKSTPGQGTRVFIGMPLDGGSPAEEAR